DPDSERDISGPLEKGARAMGTRDKTSMAQLLGGVAVLLLLGACGMENADDSAAPDGRALFRRACAICHLVADPETPAGKIKLVGPNLYGVYGAPAGRRADYAYSAAMASSDVVWTDTTLDAFLTKPSDFMKGTRMSYVGESDASNRAAIIGYLKGLEKPLTDQSRD
ncbi:MAG: c-type cytochrome, partial [Pseudomonadota bacterium]